MQITAITTFKLGILHKALKQAGWSQSELARRLSVHPTVVSNFMRLKRKPGIEMANRIQAVFGEANIFIDPLEVWPSDFKPLRKAVVVEETQEVEPAALLNFDNQPRLLDYGVTPETFESAWQQLTEAEQELLEGHFVEGKTLEQLGVKLFNRRGRGERARQAVSAAASRMRELLGPSSVEKEDERFDLISAVKRARSLGKL